MKRVLTKIQLNNYSYTGCISIQIIHARDSYTQTAVIKMPNIFYRQKGKPVYIQNDYLSLDKLIDKGDVVKVWCGYNKTIDELPLRFTGFITRIQIDEIITITCEDYAYALKLVNVPSKAFTEKELQRKVIITDIVEYALTDLNITVEYDDKTLEIGDWEIDNNSSINALQVLEKLEDLGIRVYFQGTTLRIGGTSDVTGETKCFIFEHNIIENNLEYITSDELVLKGISNLITNEKIERYAYYANNVMTISEDAYQGEQRTLNFYNLTASKLEENLRNNFNKYIYNGYSGNFQTYLEPFISVNDYVNLYSLKQPEKNGQYKVKSVETNISTQGGFQTIGLDYKIKNLAKV